MLSDVLNQKEQAPAIENSMYREEAFKKYSVCLRSVLP